MSQLRESLSRVQADHERIDQRLNTLEVHSAEAPRAPAKAQAPTPTLRVVRLNPNEPTVHEEASETASALAGTDPNDTAPRPVIRVSGTRGKRGRSADHVEEFIPDEPQNGGTQGPPITPDALRPSALDPQAKPAYEAALALARGKQCGKALEAFAAFLVKWPDHPYADNAMYWRGECYLALGDTARGAEELEGLIARFPHGNKMPDALLKLGVAYQKLGASQRSQTTFERLGREFPSSEAARHIPREAPVRREATP